MAAGDLIFFNQFKIDLGNKIHDLDSDTWKLGFITGSITPNASDSNPHWNGTGTTNLYINQVTPGGNYTDGGPTLQNLEYTNVSGSIHWRANKVTITDNPANPTAARWMILYNDSDMNKRCAGFLDLGVTIDLSAAPFEYRFNGIDGVGTIAIVS